MEASSSPPSRLWDIFCSVVDNYGDIGVCWRLAMNLAQRGQRVRLWIDDSAPLQWLAPHGHAGVEVLPWNRPLADTSLPMAPADVLIEAFGCTLDDAVQTRWARQQHSHPGVWLNLEYLSAESHAERFHRLPSPVMSGPAAGCVKYFFYPGFTPQTGGLLREPGLLLRQQAFDRTAWRAQLGVPDDAHMLSLFCYEPPVLSQLLQHLRSGPHGARVHALVTPGRTLQAVRAILPDTLAHSLQSQGQARWGSLVLHAMPWLEQVAFDELLWASDFNFVRGEDSLVRALWAGQPFVWQLYPQDDGAHHAKLQAFLDWMQAPSGMRRFHEAWNGPLQAMLPPLEQQDLPQWQACVQAARSRLLTQQDLASQLLAHVTSHEPGGQRCIHAPQANPVG